MEVALYNKTKLVLHVWCQSLSRDSSELQSRESSLSLDQYLEEKYSTLRLMIKEAFIE